MAIVDVWHGDEVAALHLHLAIVAPEPDFEGRQPVLRTTQRRSYTTVALERLGGAVRRGHKAQGSSGRNGVRIGTEGPPTWSPGTALSMRLKTSTLSMAVPATIWTLAQLFSEGGQAVDPIVVKLSSMRFSAAKLCHLPLTMRAG